jgi:type IV pilus assembly protein PilE
MRTHKIQGFTLIELMVVVAIVAILAAIAIPSFLNQVRKSRRAEAMTTIQDAQLKLERWRVDHADYVNTSPSSPSYPVPADTAYYDFTVTAAAGTPNNYSVTAAPLGDQQKDSCGTLAITNTTGVIAKTVTGSGTCW